MLPKWDHLQAGITNKKLLEKVEVGEELQNSIIENVFNGFENMLNLLMTKYDALSLQQHHRLTEQLELEETVNTINNNENETLPFFNTPDDCMQIICSFLKQSDYITLHNICRDSVATLRRIQNNYIKFTGNKTISDKKIILERLTSGSKELQLSALEVLSANVCRGRCSVYRRFTKCLHYEDIRKYSANIPGALVKVAVTNFLKPQQGSLLRESAVNVLILEITQMSNQQALQLVPEVIKSCFPVADAVDKRQQLSEADAINLLKLLRSVQVCRVITQTDQNIEWW